MTLVDGEAIYQKLESDTTTIDPILRDQQLRFARLAFHACGGARREWECAVEETAFRYWAQELGEKGARFSWGGSPSPVSTWTDMNTIPPDAADYLRQKASTTGNPIHRARYLDVLWDRSGDYRSGIAAIQAYLDCCAIYRNNAWDKDLRDALHRAGQLARLLNQKAARDQVVKEVRLSLEFLESDGRPHWIGRVASELPQMPTPSTGRP